VPQRFGLARAQHAFHYVSRSEYTNARKTDRYREKYHMNFAIIPFIAFAFAAAAGPLAAAEGNAAAGNEKNSMCAGCHGIPGYKTAFPEVYSVPKIGGQHAAYIVKALQAYKSGERTHPSMRAIAATLSEQDMADLAAYYAAGQSQSAAK
jgi:cytochrome c553